MTCLKMYSEDIPRVSDNGEQGSKVDASDGYQLSNRVSADDSLSSSSEDEEGIVSPPPDKRRKILRKYNQVQTRSDRSSRYLDSTSTIHISIFNTLTTRAR